MFAMESITMSMFNVELFIEEIRSRPAIWDIRCAEYSDKVERSEAWREVARRFYADFDSMEPAKQSAIVLQLNKKWKNLRQCYKRERDSQILKSGSAKKKKTQYIYFDVLSFLAPVFTTKPSHSNVGDADDDDDEEEEGEMDEVPFPPVSVQLKTENTDPLVQSSSAFSKRKRDTKDPVADVCELLKRSLEERMVSKKRKDEREEAEEDVNFFMSLLNYTRAVQGLNKLAMRSELLQVVSKYYNMSIHPHHPLQHSSVPATFPHSTSYSRSPQPNHSVKFSQSPSTSASVPTSPSDHETV